MEKRIRVLFYAACAVMVAGIIAANFQSWRFSAKTKSLNAETNRILKDVDRVILRSREMQKQYYEIDTTAIPVPVHRLH